jgi:ABC-type branched-subunit amino acid transport system substrate-binding protein
LNSTFFTAPDFTIYSKNNNADQFINSFRAKTSKDPFWNAAIEYDALLIIGDAINRSNGSLDSLQIVLSEVKEFDGVVGRYNLVGSEWISPLTIKTFINDTLSLIYQP